MALAGEGAICIWNGITPEGRAEFYAWHLNEHMPERVGVSGFLRGRRYIASDARTSPEFFTLYETTSYDILVGPGYLDRLNDPTPWTKSATSAFRNTQRALTHVVASFGQGPGGILATLRFTAGDDARLLEGLAAKVLPSIARLPQITGVHLCVTDAAASAVKTAESRGRADVEAAPDRVILIEGCNSAEVAAALDAVLADPASHALPNAIHGLYRLEHMRTKSQGLTGE